MKIVSFIPIKLNNERLPGKNLLPIDGKPMCCHLFDTIRQIDEIDEKYVYCSDEKIRDYMPDGLIFLKRDARLDGYQVRGLEIIDAFVRDVKADIYVLAHVTQPFTKAASVRGALSKVISGDYDSAFSALVLQDYLWMNGQPLNYDPENIVRTQDLSPVYMETGGFFIFRREVYVNLGRRIGEKPCFYPVDAFEAVDVDTREDYAFAQVTAAYLREKA